MSDDDFAFTLNSHESGHITVDIARKPVRMLIDSGASCNTVSSSVWRSLEPHALTLQPVTKKIYPYGTETPLTCKGKFSASISVDGNSRKHTTEFIVIDGNVKALLSRQTSLMLGVLKLSPEAAYVKVVNSNNADLETKYAGCFQGFGKLKDYQLKLHIDKNISPVAQPLRRLPFNVRKAVTDKLDELEQMDVIERVNGPTPWVSPLVVVPKPSGEVHICVDMRRPTGT